MQPLREQRLVEVALSLCLVLFFQTMAYATTYYVATDGADNNAGTQTSPFQTIQKGIDAASPGDTVSVLPGVYNERLIIGVGKDNVTVEGVDGAIIDGSDPFAGEWKLDKGFSKKWGVYSTSLEGYSGEPRAVFVDDQIVAVQDYPENTRHKIPEHNIWYWKDDFKYGLHDAEQIPWYDHTPDGWNGMKALAMYRGDADKMYLKIMPDGDNATHTGSSLAGHTIKWSNRKTNVITIDGSNAVTVRHFQIKYGWLAVDVRNSKGTIIEGCQIVPTRNGIQFGAGTDACIARFNEIASYPYADLSSWGLADDYWQFVKNGGFGPYAWEYDADTAAVMIRDSVGNHGIHDNYIHDAWDGVSTGNPDEGLANETGVNHNIEVYHNFIKNMVDDSLDPSCDCTNGRWHANLIVNGHQHIRVRIIWFGPFYLYNNIFLEGPLQQHGIMFYGDYKNLAPEIYIYNNTVDESTDSKAKFSGLYVNSDKADFTNTRIYNNLFYGDQYVWGHLDALEANHWTSDCNVFVRKSDAWNPDHAQSYAQNILGVDLRSLWTTSSPGFVDYPNGNVALTPDSPARGRGADLSSWGLPGGYSTDCGALPYGTAMPEYYPFQK